MKNKLLLPTILLILLLLSIVGYFILTEKLKLPEKLETVDDSPSYVELSSCSEIAQFVIETRKFPLNLIHACKTSKHVINNEVFYVVEISYGAAQDCPAGCFYDFFIGAVPENKETIIDLPGSYGDSKNYILTTVSLPYHNFDKIDFKCNADLDSVTEIKLAKYSNQVGWQFSFTKPYSCTWKEVKSTKVTMDNTFIHTADEITRSWEGSMFVYLQNGNYQWNFDDIETKEVGRKEVIFKEG